MAGLLAPLQNIMKSNFLSFHMDLISSTCYASASFGLTILNKIVVTRFFFDYPTVLLMFQMACLLFSIELLRIFGVVKIPPYTFDRGKDMIFISLCYSLNAYLSLAYLDGMSLPMFQVIKRFVPIVALTLSIALLKRPLPTRQLVLISTAASVLTALACLDDAIYGYFDIWSWIYGCGGVLIHSLWLVQVEKLHQSKQYSPLELTYMNAFNGLVIFLVADLAQDEIRDAFMYFITSSSRLFWILFVGMLIVGSLMNYAVFYAILETDAVCVSLVGNFKQVVFICFGWMFGFYIFLDISPVALNLFACLGMIALFGFYTYKRQVEKYQTRSRKEVGKKCLSGTASIRI